MKKRKQREYYLAKILISVLLGFLPSFIFVVILIQYGNPFLNYVEFLSNFSSSYGAWISAILLSAFAYFILGVVASKKLFKKIMKNKILLIGIIVMFLIAFFLMALQLYLYANFILRNDILVELSSPNENIFFTNNLQEGVSFDVNLIMNPFCSAYCEYQFLDIGSGEIIEEGFFSTTILSKSKRYEIENKNLVEGSQELKQFEIKCKSKKTLFCYTSERESKRKVLVTVNYQLDDDEKEFKNNSRDEINEIDKLLYSSKNNLTESFSNLDLIDGYFSNEKFSEDAKLLENDYNFLIDSLESAKDLWRKQNFDLLELSDIRNSSENLSYETGKLNDEIISNISFYNGLVDNMNSAKSMLDELAELFFENSRCDVLEGIVLDYNNAVVNFNNVLSLDEKKAISDLIYAEVLEFYNNPENILAGSKCVLDISEIEINKLEIVSEDFPFMEFYLADPDPVCCFYGVCEKCFDDEDSSKNYPVLFLHGQSINEAISVGYSFDAFSEVKESLVDKGYLDAGAIILSSDSEEGLWGKVNATLIMTGSYFFDTYKTESGEVTISSNKDDIDTYAERLNKLVKLIKARTNKDKVVIAAHSMGGVVTRRYLQVFGSDDVEKAILVTSPNQGVEEKVKDYCVLIGPEASCNDLDKKGNFMKELNEGPKPNIPIYNIVGIGCDMGDDSGDGVIRSSNQYLESAENYYFEGTCDEINFEFFHEYIIFPDFYPEVFDKIYELLKSGEE